MPQLLVLTRPEGGITLNSGREVLRREEKPLLFSSRERAFEFLTDEGFDEDYIVEHCELVPATAEEIASGEEA